MFRKRHPGEGSRPGTLVIPEGAPPPTIRLVEYSADGVSERDIADVEELAVPGSAAVRWVDVQGLGDEDVLRRVAALFGIHVLALEDVVNVPQRPKVEQFDNYLFIVTRMVRLISGEQFDAEQVAIFVGDGVIITFQERPGDILDPIRERIRQGKGPMRSSGADYLAYAILDRIIDGYYPVLESFGEALESLQEEIFREPRPEHLERIFAFRRDSLSLRRAIWPQRDALNELIRDRSPQISDHVRVYLRDCYDHAVQSIDVMESLRELAGGLMDLYLSTVGHSQNEVMKVLTIMASIFIPLTFLAGIFGMNFDIMPELQTPWMYPLVLGVMVVLAGGMLFYFKRKGWIWRK